jgi:hypothetical protein
MPRRRPDALHIYPLASDIPADLETGLDQNGCFKVEDVGALPVFVSWRTSAKTMSWRLAGWRSIEK